MLALYHEVLYRPILNLTVGLYDLLFNDFGLAILALTVLVRGALWPLTHRALANQKAMMDLQPKLKAVQEKYKDNKEEQAKAMMALYAEHKVSPFSSCLPLLIQLPLFIALYRVLSAGLKSENLNELYGFISNPGTISTMSLGFLDLSKPSIVLAVLAAAAQFFQAKMMQRKDVKVHTEGSKDEDTMAIMNKQMLYMMPAMTLFIGWKLPAGLTLYWLFTNLAMIAQQKLAFKKKE
ncbi:MAG TPA: YidC/Oxa1 family membrane protein insertase [Patescibacteria group bacterium]|nr:YidC/Oxa1 family membrane protein insertase [Patescibacteria group bacterium]